MRRKIIRVLEEMINPAVASHGGKIELVDVVNDTVYIQMTGGCQGCAASSMTLKQGVERTLMEEIPDIKAIVDTTDHQAGGNPYYQAGK
jgi:Fe-S cluster biogenesis protein NfuA